MLIAFLFDVGFDKPPWLSIEDNMLKVAGDVTLKSTAFVRPRGINTNGASELGVFGFYVYVRTYRTPEWKDFKALSMYPNQVLNMFEFVENADEIEWAEGFTVPSNLYLDDNGKLTVI